MRWIAIDWADGLTITVRLLGRLPARTADRVQREACERTMLRTFPLVSFSSAAYLVLAHRFFDPDPNAQMRVLAGLVTGIGFTGAGAILKLPGEDSVHGTATAASVWTTGAIGAAMAYGEYLIAIPLSAVTYATFRWMTPLEETVERRADQTGR